MIVQRHESCCMCTEWELGLAKNNYCMCEHVCRAVDSSGGHETHAMQDVLEPILKAAKARWHDH